MASGRVVIVNQTLAMKLFGTADAVGRNVRLGRKEPVDAEIVGVTVDGKYAGLDEAPQPYLYLPLSQDGRSEVTLIVTMAGRRGELLPVVRKALQQMSPNHSDHQHSNFDGPHALCYIPKSHGSVANGISRGLARCLPHSGYMA